MTGPERNPRRSGRCTVLQALLAASLLVGCVGSGGTTWRQAGPTPPDPPPLPVRKPQLPAVQTAAVTSAAPRVPASRGTVVTYAVQSGDTVFGIGRRLSVPLRSIIDANGLRPPYQLRSGQALRIPNPRKHVVTRGDTVYGIARRYRVDLSELVRLNQVQPPYTISTGQNLILPVPARPPTRVAAAAPAPPMPSRTMPALEPAAPDFVEKSLSPATQSAALRPPPAMDPPPASAPPTPVAIPKPPPRGASTFLWPVRGTLVSTYGPSKGGQHNDGINISAPHGAPVRAAENGVVAYVGNELRGFGNLILVKHANGWVTAYAHNQRLLVRRGDTVARGQTIAEVGSSGNVASPQLHFEIRQGTRAVDPLGLLDPQKASLLE